MQERATGAAPADLRDFAALFWRRKWLVAGVIGAALGAALLLSFRQTPVYTAKASVLLEESSDATPQDKLNMATEKLVAGSSAVAKIVLATLHLPGTPEEVLRGLSVDVPVDTEILNFSYSSHDPSMAQQRAEAFAQAYLTFRHQKLVDDVLASQRSLQSQLSALNDSLAAVEKKAEGASPHQQDVLRAQAASLTNEIGARQQKLAELTPSQEVSSGRIIADAVVPSSPSRPRLLVNAGLGLLLGIMVAIGAALLWEHVDDRLRGSEDFESRLGAPVLGAVPAVPRLRGPPTQGLVTLERPNSSASEAFRQVRANLVVAATACGAKAILVTSPRDQEGRSFTTANLGLALAKSGRKVVLLSADVRQPGLEGIFGIDGPRPLGFTDVLANGHGRISSPLQVAWSVGDNLTIVPAGSDSDDPVDLLDSKIVSRVIHELRTHADFVLVDAAPLLPVADAATVVPACDAVLLVADARSSTRANVTEARQQLDRMNAKVLGAVLVNAHGNGLRSPSPS
ncbi:MAG TPA: polysaccharide biosynthesis tyrosine autokinase [Actinomycetes bacterium]